MAKRERDRLYQVYCGMKSRCYNPNVRCYKNYGGRGITICDEWLNDFEAFKKWMLEHGYDYSKSRKEQQIDRKDNDKGYSPDNCRIVTNKENCRNKSTCNYLTYEGETLTPKEWAEKIGIPYRTITSRMKRLDDVEKILFGELNSDKSNTGIKGISYQKSNNRFILHINHKYLGCFKTIEEAVKRKEEYIKSNGA